MQNHTRVHSWTVFYQCFWVTWSFPNLIFSSLWQWLPSLRILPSQSKLSFSETLPLKISIFKYLRGFPLIRVPMKVKIAPDKLIGNSFRDKIVWAQKIYQVPADFALDRAFLSNGQATLTCLTYAAPCQPHSQRLMEVISEDPSHWNFLS